jgi:hypothetical protein
VTLPFFWTFAVLPFMICFELCLFVCFNCAPLTNGFRALTPISTSSALRDTGHLVAPVRAEGIGGGTPVYG